MRNKPDLSRLVFIDESGVKTNTTRLRGRAKGGQRLVDSTPHGHWCATTMISSIRLDGSTACMAIDEAVSVEVFREYVSGTYSSGAKPGGFLFLGTGRNPGVWMSDWPSNFCGCFLV